VTTAVEGLGRCPGTGMPPVNGVCPVCGHWATISREMPPHGETVAEDGARVRWMRVEP